MQKRLLLVSNSTLHGSGYLDHCADEIKAFLSPEIKSVLFIPYARPGGISHDEYAGKAAERYARMGFALKSIHESDKPVEAVNAAEAIFIGGGNTFVLLDELYKSGIIPAIRSRVENGMPYIGTSAGSNVAGPSIKTTNDMPIRQIESFEALNLFPYQLNPHFLGPDPGSTHKGETRETRIREYMVFNDTPVIGLREGCLIHAEGDDFLIKGTTDARVFRKGSQPVECKPVCSLDFLR